MTVGSLSDAQRETIAVFDNLPRATPLTTAEVAESLDMGRRGAYDRLDQLVEAGHLETKEVGARARVWWQPHRGAPTGGADNGDTPIASIRSLVATIEEYAIALLDIEGRVTTWNAGATRIKGYEPYEVIGEPIAIFYPDVDVADGVPEDDLIEAAATGSVEVEGWRVRKDGSRFRAAVTITAIRDDANDLKGYGTVTRDLTEHHLFEARLRHQLNRLEAELDEMFERVDEAFFALDEQWQFTYVNDRAAAMAQRSVGEMLGSPLTETFPEMASGHARGIVEEALAHQESAEFDCYAESLGTWVEVRVFPSESGVSVYFRDISERKAHELELERYRTVVETVGDGIYIVDEAGRFTMVNDQYVDMTGYPRSELIGCDTSMVVDESIIEVAQEYEQELLAGERNTARIEADIRTADGETVRAEATFAIIPSDDDTVERVGVVRDVTDRVQRERELERYETIVETVDDGIYVVDPDDRFLLVNSSYEAFVGQPRRDLIGSPISAVVDDDSAVLGSRWRTEFDIASDNGGRVELDMDDADGRTRTVEINFATLEIDGEFTGTTGVIRDVTERKRHERTLERQREHLAALDYLNGVVRSISDDVIDRSTRKEIAQTLCDRLAASESFEFAWIGDVDAASQAITHYVDSGADGWFENLTISIDPDNPECQGPIIRAVQTQTVQTVEDLSTEPVYRQFQTEIGAPAIRSAAAIPLVYDGQLYGILNVAASRADAFVGREREVVAQLGEVVGHAIAAVERKRALMSDEIVELELRLPRFAESVDLDVPAEGLVTIDRTVPIGNDEYLVYGMADEGGVDVVKGLAAVLDHWEDVDFIATTGDSVRLLIRLSEPPVLAVVASKGGSVDELVIEDGEIYMRIHLLPGTDTRSVIDVIQEAYPTTEMVSRRQISRPDDENGTRQGAAFATLTDRQRAVIEVAYNSGFFERPRLTSGEEIADAMGITPATFHEHLRKAEQAILGEVVANKAD